MYQETCCNRLMKVHHRYSDYCSKFQHGRSNFLKHKFLLPAARENSSYIWGLIVFDLNVPVRRHQQNCLSILAQHSDPLHVTPDFFRDIRPNVNRIFVKFHQTISYCLLEKWAKIASKVHLKYFVTLNYFWKLLWVII